MEEKDRHHLKQAKESLASVDIWQNSTAFLQSPKLSAKSHAPQSRPSVTQDKVHTTFLLQYMLCSLYTSSQLSFSNSVQLIFPVQLHKEINTYVSLLEIKCTPAV